MDVRWRVLESTCELDGEQKNVKNSALFVEHVKRDFAFLVDEFGFAIDSEFQEGDSASIVYCSERIYVKVFQGPPAFEPQIAFGRIGIDDQASGYSFEQGDLTLLGARPEWEWRKRDGEPHSGLIPELARLLKERGERCLNCDAEVFLEMATRREQLAEQWKRHDHSQAIRLQAEAAWKRKDLQAVVTLYGEIHDELTAVEQRRLSYAQKQGVAVEHDGRSG